MTLISAIDANDQVIDTIDVEDEDVLSRLEAAQARGATLFHACQAADVNSAILEDSHEAVKPVCQPADENWANTLFSAQPEWRGLAGLLCLLLATTVLIFSFEAPVWMERLRRLGACFGF